MLVRMPSLCKTANRFKSNIEVECDDEIEAVTALNEIVDSNFGEE